MSITSHFPLNYHFGALPVIFWFFFSRPHFPSSPLFKHPYPNRNTSICSFKCKFHIPKVDTHRMHVRDQSKGSVFTQALSEIHGGLVVLLRRRAALQEARWTGILHRLCSPRLADLRGGFVGTSTRKHAWKSPDSLESNGRLAVVVCAPSQPRCCVCICTSLSCGIPLCRVIIPPGPGASRPAPFEAS